VTPADLYTTLIQASQAVEHLKQVLPASTAAKLLERFRLRLISMHWLSCGMKKLFKNTLTLRALDHQQTTVIVTGGFHTRGLAEQCKRQRG